MVADHVLADARLADGNAKLEQFAVNPRCAPERVVAAHRTNQRSDIRRDCWSPRPPPPNLPSPEQAEALAVPTDHRRRLHDDGARLPIHPDRRQPGPQESINGRQLRPLHRALQNTELMTKGQNLKLKRRTMAKERHESRRQRHQRRRARESKEERQPSLYQQLRGLREPQTGAEGAFHPYTSAHGGGRGKAGVSRSDTLEHGSSLRITATTGV